MDVQQQLEESNILQYLCGRGWLSPGEDVQIEPAGDGNINWVRRIRAADGRSIVVKQARPALERFPEYRVSTERIVFEARYLEHARPFDDARLLPQVLDFDAEQRVLLLEDLGDAPRLDRTLAEGRDASAPLHALARFLGRVHAGTRGRDAELAARFANAEMQRLHGDHVFHLPYRENDFPLSPALRARAEAIWRDSELVARIDAAYARYLEPRGALVHADVQAGNVLLAPRGPVLLDAEIAHVGDPAFDIGMLLAHVLLAGMARDARGAATALVGDVFAAYARAHGAMGCPAKRDALRYAGIELLRRTLGAARVIAVERDAVGLAVVDVGVALVLGEEL